MAREQLRKLDLQSPIYYIDDSGSRVFLDAEERAENIDFYNTVINSICG